MPQTEQVAPPRRAYTITRETLEKAQAGRRAAKERREQDAYERARKIEAAEARRVSRHNRDPHVKLYRREVRRRGDGLSPQLAEAKAMFDQFWAAERERRKGGRPKSGASVARHPDVRGRD